MAMVNAFRSKSLVYRAIEDNEEDKAFMHSLWLDPQSLYQNNYEQLHRPISRSNVDLYHKAKEASRLIDVMICLPVGNEKLESQKEPNSNAKKVVPIGFINLHGMTQGTRHHRTLDVGILIAAEHRGQGYGSEAVRWILNWGFEIAGLHRIGLQSASYNTEAIRLWKRLGFQQDGKDREALWMNGRWHDDVRFSILEGEWRAMMERQKDESNDYYVTWGAEGFYFAESGEFAWGDISRAVAKIAQSKKFIGTAEVDSISADETDKLVPHGAYLLGTTARGKAVRARRVLGWKPVQKPLEQTLPDVVEREARELKITHGHAEKAAGVV